MHPVLCIDEILQLIFDLCGDLPNTEPKWTYAQLARCCKTWMDPALARLWRRMGGLGPLLALLPKGDEEPSRAFEGHTKRVRHVVYAEGFARIPSFKLSGEHGPNVFPNLESVALINDGCLAPPAWMTSPRLKRVIVNLSFSRKNGDVNAAITRYLSQLPHLHTLQLRGRMSDTLNAILPSLNQLRNLTVQASNSLSCDTLAAIATFPALRTFEVHATHICVEDFEDALDRICSMEAACFPALEELCIRTNAPLLAALLARLPTGMLRKLHLDMDADRDRNDPATSMKPAFELLAQKAVGSLRELLVEDCAEHDGSEAASGTRRGYGLDVLSPLARVKQLRTFILREPDLFDKDLETMAHWWPALERLDLGTVEWCAADATETAESESGEPDEVKTQMTPAAYAIVARSFRFLESLTLAAAPPTTMATAEESARFVTALRSLTVGGAKYTKTDAPAVVDSLLSIFPTLKSMDCPDVEVPELFETVLAVCG